MNPPANKPILVVHFVFLFITCWPLTLESQSMAWMMRISPSFFEKKKHKASDAVEAQGQIK